LTPLPKDCFEPADFAEELRRFYGAEKGGSLQVLLTGHLTIAAELVDAARREPTAA
jgi:hypothetical protein